MYVYPILHTRSIHFLSTTSFSFLCFANNNNINVCCFEQRRLQYSKLNKFVTPAIFFIFGHDSDGYFFFLLLLLLLELLHLPLFLASMAACKTSITLIHGNMETINYYAHNDATTVQQEEIGDMKSEIHSKIATSGCSKLSSICNETKKNYTNCMRQNEQAQKATHQQPKKRWADMADEEDSDDEDAAAAPITKEITEEIMEKNIMLSERIETLEKKNQTWDKEFQTLKEQMLRLSLEIMDLRKERRQSIPSIVGSETTVASSCTSENSDVSFGSFTKEDLESMDNTELVETASVPNCRNYASVAKKKKMNDDSRPWVDLQNSSSKTSRKFTRQTSRKTRSRRTSRFKQALQVGDRLLCKVNNSNKFGIFVTWTNPKTRKIIPGLVHKDNYLPTLCNGIQSMSQGDPLTLWFLGWKGEEMKARLSMIDPYSSSEEKY